MGEGTETEARPEGKALSDDDDLDAIELSSDDAMMLDLVAYIRELRDQLQASRRAGIDLAHTVKTQAADIAELNRVALAYSQGDDDAF